MKDENIKEDLLKPILIEDLGMMFATEDSKQKKRFGIYKCGFCGDEFRTQILKVKSGNTKSCGCYQKQKTKEIHTKHGMKKHPLNATINNMVQRCENPKTEFYPDYGGRGIKVCEEWRNSRETFFNWAIQNGWEEGLTIDRIDNDGNYEPSNCRWVTPIIQSRNRRVRKDNTSGYKGVSYVKGKDLFNAYTTVNRKRIHLGLYPTAVEGAIAYNNYIIENNLEGFILNEIPLVNLIK